MSIAPADLLADLDGRYQLLDVVGRGGMATVYRAHDVKHDRTVALKVLHDDLAASLGPERFKREIRIAARLQHPHILSVFDSGESAGRLWFTMPYVQGESLRDRLRREGKLSVETALVIVREAAQALAYAHKQGVIHRDIKPENILITEDGSTLVADFGIARAIGDRTFETGLSQSLTQTGSAIGTPTYMAPEQATGETVLDERVDQYAIAAVLYEMLTGAPPFTGANAAALIAARFTTQVTPMRTTRAEVPSDVDGAVLRALALKPFDRFPTIAEFARAVAPAMATPSQFETQPRPLVRAATQRRWLTALGVVAVCALGGGALWRRHAATAALAEPLRIAVLPMQNLGDSTDAAFADGMTDELRGKLIGLPGLEVIARASSIQYAGDAKPPRQIATELGVRYLLTGTLRYDHGAGSSGSTVHLRPELVEVTDRGVATSRWQGSFDEPLTNAAALQSKIAEQVATQLRVALGAGDRARLTALPTANAAAYEAYLRGMSGLEDQSVAANRRRVAELERAVALDSGFALAWAELSRARSILYGTSAASVSLGAQAREAAEHAKTLAPDAAATRSAWGVYHASVTLNIVEAERYFRSALEIEPNNVRAVANLANMLLAQGRFDDAGPMYESALRLDPQNWRVARLFAINLSYRKQYSQARTAFQRSAALAPTSQSVVQGQVQLLANLGDLAGAQQIVREAYRRQAPEILDVYLASFFDFGWLLEADAQQRVLDAPLAAFDSDVGQREVVRAQIYFARGDRIRAREAARAAIPGLAAHAAAAPDDDQWPLLQGVAAALAGQPAEAERLIGAAAEVDRRVPPPADYVWYNAQLRARIHTLNGQYDRAFDEIEAALSKPGGFQRGQLALDPMWAPLRTLPRYQRIMATASATEAR